MTILTKKEILKAIKDAEIKFPFDGEMEETVIVIRKIDKFTENGIGFFVELVNNEMDYWLQAEYYSEKIGKTIIIDHDFIEGADTPEELADRLIETYKEAKEIEDHLPDLNKLIDEEKDYIKNKEYGEVCVSTVRLRGGIGRIIDEMGLGNNDAIGMTYETMVFPSKDEKIIGWEEIDKNNYHNKEDALRGHNKMVKKYKNL